ncbi:alpha/beta-hydrolase [Phialemonium atrogriseum]|uniref:Kynurenine formamidase n=1 Tax=Phialemonium atrogriseum TaxID=1093897 RepID=A0AAJ0C5G2_9PEZI|nr:alpha/beta-hydrolase [Phialemonium atrogriseum]KAK1770513.1 alpha/beta-hydrolase [Phialemonium atrogriseum]
MADSLKYTEYKYGTENELQRLGVWQFPTDEPSTEETKYWLVYIHGGAWRDPRIDHTTARPTIGSLLLGGGTTARPSRIAGIASLDYRLSAHPSFPQDPSREPPSRLRSARHPDHVRDVHAALALLGREFGLGAGAEGTPYVLFGHSCGATLALQVLMGEWVQDREPERVPLPAAVVGFQGMYDLAGLNARFGGAYGELLSGAFGPDEAVWEAVSPARFRGSFRGNWGADPGLAVLAYSPQDELIDMAEIDVMEMVLRDDGLDVLAFRDLEGGHDEVWEDGRHLGRVLLRTIEELDRLGKK